MTDSSTALAPVRKQVRVECGPEQAFRTFTEGIASWWPVHTHSITAGEDGSHPPDEVVFETKAGGRVYERARDGRVCEWATIVVYDPPSRVVLEWAVNPTRPATEVEVTFAADGDGTLVTLEHRGWERDLADGEAWRERYDSGWVGVLDRFVGAARSGDRR